MGPSDSNIGPEHANGEQDKKVPHQRKTKLRGTKASGEAGGSIGGAQITALPSDIATQSGDLSVYVVDSSSSPRPPSGHLSHTKVEEEHPAVEAESFPTEQRTRQKEKKKAGHVAKKKPQVVEDHHDDCGEDFGPLGEDYLVESPFDHTSDLASSSGGEECCVLASDLAQSDGAGGGGAMDFSSIESFIAWKLLAKARLPRCGPASRRSRRHRGAADHAWVQRRPELRYCLWH